MPSVPALVPVKLKVAVLPDATNDSVNVTQLRLDAGDGVYCARDGDVWPSIVSSAVAPDPLALLE